MAMLEGVDDLTLGRLNEATQAWVEQDYNRKHHSEINDTPLARFLAGPSVTRPCPDAAALRLAFTRTERRTLRKSDGTRSLKAGASRCPTNIAISPPWRVRFAAWDLTQVPISSIRTGTVLPAVPTGQGGQCLNTSRLRRRHRTGKPSPSPSRSPPPPARGIGPLLARMIDRQAATGHTAGFSPRTKTKRRRVNNKIARALRPQVERSPPTCRPRRCTSPRAWNRFAGACNELAGDGGFALVTGAPGCGKSAALRVLSASLLATQRDVAVGVISRPQASMLLLSRDGRTLRRRTAPA